MAASLYAQRLRNRMPEVAGLQYGDAVACLLERARTAFHPMVLDVRPAADAPAAVRAVGIPHRGAFVPEIPAIYLNTDRTDLDEHTLAHELGHALVHARGWPDISCLPTMDEGAATDLRAIFVNRLQHIALEPFLRACGFDTGPGHRRRLDRDLAALRAKVELEPADKTDPGTYLSWATKYAEARHTAPADAAHRFRQEIAVLCPLAERLGALLADALRPEHLQSVRYARRSIVRWIGIIDRFIAKHAAARVAAGDVYIIGKVLAIAPVPVSAGQLARPANETIALTVHQTPEPYQRVVQVIWNADGSTWKFAGVQLKRVEGDAERKFFSDQLHKPLADLVAFYGLPMIDS